MENDKAKKTDGFFAGKGFYIVLALCVAVIGISAISITLNAGEGTDPGLDPGMSLANTPAPVTETAPVMSSAEPTIVEIEKKDDAVVSTFTSDDGKDDAPRAWVWPVRGEVERGYAIETLAYDVTMRDWRTHDGIDVLAKQGELVRAASDGTVESIENDDLYGTTLIIDHGDGLQSVYSNLADTPTVKVGDKVNAGDVIGSVGQTALCETGQGSHVHVAMRESGKSIDPLKYLPS